jgi:hypothetical protein
VLVRWNLEKFTGAILCYEIGRVFASNFEKTRKKAWGTHCFNSTCYAVAIDGELFPVVLGLLTMAVLVCKKSCENLPLNPRPSHRSQIRLANIPVFVRATEMEVTIVGLQNAGKTSLLRVLAVSDSIPSSLLTRQGVIGVQNCRG